MEYINNKIKHLDVKLASNTIKNGVNKSVSVISLKECRDNKSKEKDAKIYRNILSLSDHIYS